MKSRTTQQGEMKGMNTRGAGELVAEKKRWPPEGASAAQRSRREEYIFI